MSRVAGLPNVDSQRAFDCFMKVRSVLENGGRVVCATATPVSNTIAEVYVCQKYLQLETLQELGLDHFDAWVQQFAETTQSLEMTPDGSGFRIYVANSVMWRPQPDPRPVRFLCCADAT
jgi:N12 class adenine-specific DNA methylase